MTRRVYLHVGLLKTGTTFLQDALWENKVALGARGVLVPGRHRRRHLLASLDIRDDPKLARRSGDVAHPWQDLVEEVAVWTGEAAVISHEFFAAASADQVARAVRSLTDALGEIEVHVVLTVRALTDLGPSLWQEWVKNGGTLDIDSYPGDKEYDPIDEWGWGAFDLAGILDRWTATVPPERIHVLPMTTDRSRPDELWLRFLDVLGVDPEGLPAPVQPSNQSLGLVEVELLRRVNAHLEDFGSAGDRGNWIRGYLGAGDVIPASGERFRPGEETQRALEERGQRAQELLEQGGYDVRGDVGSVRPRPPSDELRHPAEVSDGELVDAAARTIARMLSDVRSLTRERNRLVRERETALAEPPTRVSVFRFSRRRRKAQQ